MNKLKQNGSEGNNTTHQKTKNFELAAKQPLSLHLQVTSTDKSNYNHVL